MCSPANSLEFLNAEANPVADTKIVPQRWRPPAGALLRHVRVEDAGTDISYLGILVKEIRQSIQAALKHDHVRIHQAI